MKKIELTQNKFALVDDKAAKKHFGEFYND